MKTQSKEVKQKITKPKKTLSKINEEKKEKKLNDEEIKQKYYEDITKVIEEYNHNGKKTIALFCDSFYPFIDGVISVVDNYAKRLKNEFNVIVCAPRFKNNYVVRDYPILYFKSVFFDLINISVGQPGNDLEFNKLFKELHVDIIHVHSPFMVGRYGLKEARRRDIPIIATFHSQFKQDFQKIVKSKPIVNMLLANIMEVFNAVDEVWTMNEATKKTLMSYKFTGKVRIISNATDFEMPENKEELESLAESKYGIKPSDNIYCFVGRLVLLKNILLVAESLAILKQKGIPFKMIYVGDGQDRQMLFDKIDELKLGNDVILTGKVLDKQLIASILYNSQIMLFPSIYDTDGIVKYEAAAFSTPTLFLKNSNASYDIIDNENGFICDSKPENIANKLEYLYNHKEEIERVGENAHKTIYHRWDDVVKMAGEIYKDMIEMSEKEMLTKKQKHRSKLKEKKKIVLNSRLKKKINNNLI